MQKPTFSKRLHHPNNDFDFTQSFKALRINIFILIQVAAFTFLFSHNQFHPLWKILLFLTLFKPKCRSMLSLPFCEARLLMNFRATPDFLPDSAQHQFYHKGLYILSVNMNYEFILPSHPTSLLFEVFPKLIPFNCLFSEIVRIVC